MIWLFFGKIFTHSPALIRVSRLSEHDKDLEIIILRHQLDVMVRNKRTRIVYKRVLLFLKLPDKLSRLLTNPTFIRV